MKTEKANNSKLTRLLLIRHGKTEENWQGEYRLPPGPPLSLEGRTQIIALKNKLMKFPADKIYVSPYKRTEETAELLTNKFSKIIVDERLDEKTYDKSFEKVKKRVSKWLKEHIKYDRSTIWAVSHGFPINAIILLVSPSDFEGKSTEDEHSHVPRGGVWIMEWEDKTLTRSELLIGKEYV